MNGYYRDFAMCGQRRRALWTWLYLAVCAWAVAVRGHVMPRYLDVDIHNDAHGFHYFAPERQQQQSLAVPTDHHRHAGDSFVASTLLHQRLRRQTTAADKDDVLAAPREMCKDGKRPQLALNSTARLQDLRTLMRAHKIDAYIVPADDEHGSEYIAKHDHRRAFISGFTGSAGTAVITTSPGEGKAALWTDGRYFLQAERELDCNWLLMRAGIAGTPSIATWLGSMRGDILRVGATPNIVTNERWQLWRDELKEYNVELAPVDENLIDTIWSDGSRPSLPETKPFVLPLKFAGKKWEDKVADLRRTMRKPAHNWDAVVVSALDEVAWLFNMRGDDIPYNPVFKAFVVVSQDEILIFTNTSRILSEPELLKHLQYGNMYCKDKEYCVQLFEYDTVIERLKEYASDATRRILVSSKSSYAIFAAVPERQRVVRASPLLLPKSIKNPIELEGMRNSHLRDSAALVEFWALVEDDLTSSSTTGNASIQWTEVQAARKLEEIRQAQEHFFGLSFPAISAFGPNGAVIHYEPRVATDQPITTKSLYLLDSGGQYYDGTTDNTRTTHFGTPDEKQREAYTRVLMGAIDLAMLKFPTTAYGRDFDGVARRPLWEVGWDYMHGTGHGIGMFLNVHEGPQRISAGCGDPDAHAFEAGMFTSDATQIWLLEMQLLTVLEYGNRTSFSAGQVIAAEPGYYEDGKWGIRLETIMLTKVVETPNQFKNLTWLGFEPIDFVPFEAKLIMVDLLRDEQLAWLNDYHQQCRDKVSPLLERKAKQQALSWLRQKTEPISRFSALTSNSTRSSATSSLLLLSSSTSTLPLVTLSSIFTCVAFSKLLLGSKYGCPDPILQSMRLSHGGNPTAAILCCNAWKTVSYTRQFDLIGFTEGENLRIQAPYILHL